MPIAIEPEVAGGLGEGTVLDSSVHPPRVLNLVYEFEGWLGDDLVESFPCFLVTDRLGRALEEADLSGFSLAEVRVAVTDEFPEHAAAGLPSFHWLQVTGRPDEDDFWVHSDFRLAVSDRALDVLQSFQIANAVLENLG